MKAVSRLGLAVFLVLLFAASSAQAQVLLCNRFTKTIEIAHTEENKGTLQVVGWKRVAPKACLRIAATKLHSYAYYAHVPGTDVEWTGDEDGEEFCVHMNRGFRIDYDDIDEDFLDADDFACPAGAEKRRFMVLDPIGPHNINLD